MPKESDRQKNTQREIRALLEGLSDFIIAEDEEGTLVICECKYRSKSKWQDPSAAVDVKKQRQICRTALYYCMKRGYGVEHPCRFDVIAIYGDESIRHIENAFEFRR